MTRETGGVVLALLGIAALMMAVNGTLGRVWDDLKGANGPDRLPGGNFTPWNGGNPGGDPNQVPPNSGGSTFNNGPAPSPAQPGPSPFGILSGFPGSGVRTNA